MSELQEYILNKIENYLPNSYKKLKDFPMTENKSFFSHTYGSCGDTYEYRSFLVILNDGEEISDLIYNDYRVSNYAYQEPWSCEPNKELLQELSERGIKTEEINRIVEVERFYSDWERMDTQDEINITVWQR